MGNVSLVLPPIHPMVGINSLPAVNHQPEFTAHCITQDADQALLDGALAMAWTAIDMATNDTVRSGRDRRVVQELMGLDNLIVAGSHGFDIWSPTGVSIQREEGASCEGLLRVAQARLPSQPQLMVWTTTDVLLQEYGPLASIWLQGISQRREVAKPHAARDADQRAVGS